METEICAPSAYTQLFYILLSAMKEPLKLSFWNGLLLWIVFSCSDINSFGISRFLNIRRVEWVDILVISLTCI